MASAVEKGWSGLFSGTRAEWQPSRFRCWEFKIILLLSRVLLRDLASALQFPGCVEQYFLKARRSLYIQEKKNQEASCKSICRSHFKLMPEFSLCDDSMGR